MAAAGATRTGAESARKLTQLLPGLALNKSSALMSLVGSAGFC